MCVVTTVKSHVSSQRKVFYDNSLETKHIFIKWHTVCPVVFSLYKSKE